ncbi:Ferric oxidoreductase domain-containing protein [Fusarium sp. LHS14.1]|nr:Ferric oxidoreductase domain-containing protein [Fusarium sp. LHS14.1]
MKRLALAWLLAQPVLGGGGLVGYGIYPYEPPCAYACLRSLGSLMLECSSQEEMPSGMSHGPGMTSPECRADDTPWLTTLAWCIKTECVEYHVPVSKLEGFWEKESTESPSVSPKWSYSTSLQKISKSPTQQLTPTDEYLNTTSIVDSSVYLAQYNALTAVYRENLVEAGFGQVLQQQSDLSLLTCSRSIAILVAGFGIPMALTWLGYVPYMSGLLDKVKPYFVYQAIVETYHVRPLPYLLGNAPTMGQGIYVLVFFILNLILTAVNYKTQQPHAWYATRAKGITTYIFYRTGVFAFVLLPLLILFSSRNNFLLWMTNWSHSTYMLLHRWVARMFALPALLHTLLALPLYNPAEAKKEYWIGLVWGYEVWLEIACGVWFFDRLVRVGRILKTGLRRSKVTDLGNGYVRVDVPGIRWASEPGNHVYVYFPTLNPLRPWENHPFSALPTALLSHSDSGVNSEHDDHVATLDHVDAEKNGSKQQARAAKVAHSTAGLTLLIKKSMGMTKYLKAHDNLLTLLDGPYPNTPTKEVLRCDRILLIGGGIGITSLLPWVTRHRNVKLFWSIKETASCLIEAVEGALSDIAEKDVRIGERLDISQILAEEEAAGWSRVGVIACVPGGLCDNVRAAVTTAAKKGRAVFELEVDAYSW